MPILRVFSMMMTASRWISAKKTTLSSQKYLKTKSAMQISKPSCPKRERRILKKRSEEFQPLELSAEQEQEMQVEEKWYKYWEDRQLFRAEAKSDRKPFCIVIPPPNVTGSLHMGHALNNTLQDILCRYKKMKGYNVLWQPGTDHAGIATQNVVERALPPRGWIATGGPREIHRAGVGVEREVRRHDHQPAQEAGKFLRLEPGAIHHG
jgi:hypothetical protein